MRSLAAATLRLDRWKAGMQLLRTADPALWNELAEGSQLEQDNAAALEGCRQGAARTSKTQRCTVVLKLEGAKAAGQPQG